VSWETKIMIDNFFQELVLLTGKTFENMWTMPIAKITNSTHQTTSTYKAEIPVKMFESSGGKATCEHWQTQRVCKVCHCTPWNSEDFFLPALFQTENEAQESKTAQ
jgi:hypothetical protein